MKTNVWMGTLGMTLVIGLTGCLSSNVSMQGISAKVQANGNNPDFVNPDNEPLPEPTPTEPPTPIDPQPTIPPVPPVISQPPVSQNPSCGGDQVDRSLYKQGVELVKAQSPRLFSSWGECRSYMDALFGNSYNCSKMVSATIFGCLQTADLFGAVFETDLALPVFASSNQMEVPYEYYLFGIPACEPARDFLNTFTHETRATAGGFTGVRASIRAECVSGGTLVLQVYQLHQ